MKTYVTLGVQDDCDQMDIVIVYVGQDKNKAFSFESNGDWEYYEVQTWEDGNKINQVVIGK